MTGAVGPGDLVTVTHRPHPLVGRRLLVRAVRDGSAESLLCERPGGGLVTVLRSWTDRAPGARPVQDGEPRREAGTRIAVGGAFQVSDTALHRLRASLALSVERFVGLDTVRGLDTVKSCAAAVIPRSSLRHFSTGEKSEPVSRPVRKGGRAAGRID
ncbi:Y4bD/Y4pK family protein [Streptomyces sp. HUAS TT20]|uniref:Y4bD/Y4pK family protein n=1 Tax=Streptomyces sp. HUAS TT20 TaxID=3447509 RepID=UPI0021D8A453|nr:Y4bD/Y4pK family protein [Streptomyces sp. HUAS 15-9]UXY30485.1 Y4bD/Y4pK family protein [Streptomyces sp. HUAS 15-9]